ncbi:MAG: AAA family ATPase, partial [Planctomycetia bacterium]|nr:AAA family ATPase [Planctomycetia bacterium]
MLRRTTTEIVEPEVRPVSDAARLPTYLQLVRRIPIAEHLMEYVLKLVRATRPETGKDPSVKRCVRFGAGPRATQSVVLAAKSHAAISGRPCVTVDDILRVLTPVLRHRILLNFAARAENVTVESLITGIVDRISPRSDPRGIF